MTDADFLHDCADLYIDLRLPGNATRLRAIALDHERMERELTRLMQEDREANAAREAINKGRQT